MRALAEIKEQQVKMLEEFRKQANGPERETLKQKTREMLVKANLLTETGELTEACK